MMTINSTINKYLHRNCKHSEDRVQPKFNMAQSAHKMNQKLKHGVNRKSKREVETMSASSSCASNVGNDFNPSALQWFYNQWKTQNIVLA